ncbi:MAG: DUF3313 family protein [Woeseiaceae bacterium]|nr:DUF3313 family protein [Woeseiaceae bacterium]
MARFASRTTLLGIIVMTAVLGGCVKTTSTSFVRNSSSLVEYAYVNPEADFSRYSALMSDGLEIYFPSNMDAPDRADVERIRESFRNAFRNAIGDDYRIVDKPGKDVLKVRAQLIDMKVTGAGGDFIGSGRMHDLVAHGELTFVMEIIDSRSGVVLGRAGDRTHTVPSHDHDSAWEEIDAAAEHWAGLFRDWLDRTIPKS